MAKRADQMKSKLQKYKSQKRRLFTASEKDSGERLDKWLCKKMPDISRKNIKRILDSGRVLVDNRQIYIAGWEIKAKDKVEILAEGEMLKKSRYIKVVYEDRDIIVVDKPAGILSVPQKETVKENMFDAVKDYLKRKHESDSYLYPLHRLDAETSGLLVFAKSNAAKRLKEDFKRHSIERRYVAIVKGAVKKHGGRIDAPLEKGEYRLGRKARTSRGGKYSSTEYIVKERYPHSTMIELNVKTGRTHQIRVHTAAIGHPIIGDKLYGEGASFGRCALHAFMLGIKHPKTKKRMLFKSPIPKDMKGLVDRLRSGGR